MNHRLINIFVSVFVVFILVLGIPSFISISSFIYFSQAQNTHAEYYLDDADELYLNVFEFLVYQRDLSSKFTADETSHMHDVRLLFNFFRVFSVLFFISLLAYFFYLKKIVSNNVLLTRFFRSLFVGCVISFVLVLFILLVSFFDFVSSFDIFHRVFFPQGNWLFPADSLLITLFPQSFFFSIAKKILFSSLIISSILGVISYYFYSFFKRS